MSWYNDLRPRLSKYVGPSYHNVNTFITKKIIIKLLKTEDRDGKINFIKNFNV